MRRPLPGPVRSAVLAAHGGVCRYCEEAPADEADHIHPVSRGGTDNPGNLIAACRLCNSVKGDSLLPAGLLAMTLAKATEARPAVEKFLATARQRDEARNRAVAAFRPHAPNMTGSQLRAARALLGWSAEALSEASKVGVATIRRAEGEARAVRMTAANADAVQRALEAAGVALQRHRSAGVLLKAEDE